MLFRIYFWSIGPLSLISVYTDWISYDLYHLFYAPIFWLTDYCPVTHARYCRLIETWVAHRLALRNGALGFQSK